MKRRILFSAALCMLVSFSFAQKKAVKDAKSAMNSKKYEEANALIRPALEDPETANDPETWKIYGDIGYHQFEEENKRMVMGQMSDDAKMYNGLLAAYKPYLKADELGQLPDEKGNIKNKFRKNISDNLRYGFPYLRNGGAVAIENNESAKALEFFMAYWNMPTLDLFKGNKDAMKYFAEQDTSIQEVKYFAAIVAMNMNDTKKAIEILDRITKEPFIPNPTYQESDIYEYLASQYIKEGDTAKFITALESGATKFPQSKYFVPNLINQYIDKGQLDKALSYLDKAIANDPANTCDFMGVKASIYADKKDYEKAEGYYNEALAKDGNCERALEGLAVTYILQAQDLKEKSAKSGNRSGQTTFDEQANNLYKKAYPLLEKYKGLLIARNTDKSLDWDIKQALVKLRNVYYNLNMPEFDATEAEMAKYND